MSECVSDAKANGMGDDKVKYSMTGIRAHGIQSTRLSFQSSELAPPTPSPAQYSITGIRAQVYRVPCFLTSCPNRVPPPPHPPCRECALPPYGSKGGNTLACGGGGGGPDFDEGTDTLVVLCAYYNHSTDQGVYNKYLKL